MRGSCLILLAFQGACGYDWLVDADDPVYSPAAVRAVIAEESPVFFRDGQTRLGAFFEAEHRTYARFHELPETWVLAIVAAEDDGYWSHPGVSWWGILRAMKHNLQAGAVVQGGSTLSQQTAKNLFYRPDRSARSKLIELYNTLALEARYSKEDLLEFYANQFHVTSNGRGLGIAARHFFDKEPAELTLVESAFLAGLVKAPARYDPFQSNPEKRQAALEAGIARTRYVLGRMAEVPAETLVGPPAARSRPEEHEARLMAARRWQQEARDLLETDFELPFRRGAFRFDSSAVLDEIARRLALPPFDRVLQEAGIVDPATAGLTIVTTLDVQVQRAAAYGLWHHLTEVGLQLEDPGAERLRITDGRTPRWEPETPLKLKDVSLGVVSAWEDVPKKELDLDLGGRPCRVDRAALERVAQALEQGRTGRKREKASSATVDALRDALPVGSVVRASVKALPEGEVSARCDLEWRPELQGAVVVVDQGAVRAMVTGNDNRDFNRVTAFRQLGSAWKPVVYHAALSLGWSPTDALDNRRQTFSYSTTQYSPSAGHAAADFVSLSWAGVDSENVASIWLFVHLLDVLDGESLRQLADRLGWLAQPGEDGATYRSRLEAAGIRTQERFLPWLLRVAARTEVLRDRTDPLERAAFLSLPYQEEGWRQLQEEAAACRAKLELLAEGATSGDLAGWESSALRFLEDPSGQWVATCEATPDGVPLSGLLERVGVRFAAVEQARLRGPVTLGAVEAWQAAVLRRESALALRESPIDLTEPDLLLHHPDLRTRLAIDYVRELARLYGVQTELAPVLSLPLGASEVTLEEAAVLYAGLVSGRAVQLPGVGLRGPLPELTTPTALIQEIRDMEGRVIYQVQPEPVAVVPEVVGALTADVLRNVVQHGTGGRAEGAVKLGSLRVPVGGKTGTTNDNRNVAFVGFIPSPTAEGFEAAQGLVVAAYVGYDDNREMRRKEIVLQGSNGALPPWVGAAVGVAEAGLLGAFRPEVGELVSGPATLRVAVSDQDGLPAEGGPAQVLVGRAAQVERSFGLPDLQPPAALVPTEADLVRGRRWLELPLEGEGE